MATKSDIQGWFERGVKNKDRYLFVVCDSFSHEDYPVYTKIRNFWEKYDKYDGKDMQRIIEIYNLRARFEDHLNKEICFSFPPRNENK